MMITDSSREISRVDKQINAKSISMIELQSKLKEFQKKKDQLEEQIDIIKRDIAYHQGFLNSSQSEKVKELQVQGRVTIEEQTARLLRREDEYDFLVLKLSEHKEIVIEN